MSPRRIETAAWAAAAALLLLGWLRWERAGVPPPAGTAVIAPAEAPRLPPAGERLGEAARVVAATNPFRLERAPAPLRFRAPETALPPPAPSYAPAPERPPLAVSGIAGPPWRAVLEGIPGEEAGVVVAAGDAVGGLTIRAVTATTVVVAGQDTVWRLKLRTPWQ